MMDVRAFHNLGFQALDVFHFYPQIGSHSFGAVHAFGVSKKQGVFSVVTIETAQGNFAVFRFCGNASRMVECQRVGNLRSLSGNGDGPRAAVLQQFSIGDIRMTDGPVCEEAAFFSHVGCFY